MVRKSLLVLLIGAVLLTAGCWSKKEIETLAIITAVGIDVLELEEKHLWQVTLEVLHPKALAPAEGGGGGGQQSAAWVVTSLGETIEEAINNFSSRTARILFFSHANFIVIGKKAAEQANLENILSLFYTSKEGRLRTWVLVAEDRVQDVFSAGSELEQYIAAELAGMIIETRHRLSKTEVNNLKDIGAALAFPGRDVITGRVNVFRTPEPPPGGQQAQQMHSSIRLHGAGVFSEGKLAGWFGDTETRGYLYIVGKAQRTFVALQLEKDPLFDASIRIIKSSGKIRPEIEEGRARIKVEIWAEGHLEELCPGDHTVNEEFFARIEEMVARELKEEALLAVTKAQDYRADIFGFGEAIYRRYPDYWRLVKDNWRDYFVNLPVEITVDVVIRRTGMSWEGVPSR
ncbi:MAG: Ger(x)C family spore germination protein [Clostridia bacterium]|nr:Ger(x)C family spore germination protein [Clostridia bacterium]